MIIQIAYDMTGIQINLADVTARPDNVPTVELTGCRPLSPVRMEHSFTDDSGTVWRSYANMYADTFGSASNVSTPSHQGTYRDIDPLGFAWSMIPVDAEAAPTLAERYKRYPSTQPAFRNPYGPIDITMTAYVGDQKVASAIYERHQIAPDIDIIDVNDDGLRGVYYAPHTPTKKEGIIVMGGSSGGIDRYWARHVASLGYNVLNLAFFNYPGLPDTCTQIPLEYFKKAIDWLKHRTGTDRVGLQGASRGGEAVLLIASTFPDDIACTVSYVPMHVMTGGFVPGKTDSISAWTLKGADLPYAYTPVPTAEDCRARGIDLSRGLPVVPFFFDLIDEAEKDENAWIPLEKATAPILMITARDDAIWACSHGAERALDRIAKYGGTAKAEHLAFDGAGHILPPTGAITSLSTSVYHEHAGLLIALGGTPAVNAHAGDKAWQRVAQFYAENLA